MDVKYRAWDKKNKAMVTVWGINWSFDGNTLKSVFAVNPVINGEYVINEEDLILMQSTGLKDKNGVEIYQGDIISLHVEKVITFEDENEYYNRDYIGVVQCTYARGVFIKPAKGYDNEETGDIEKQLLPSISKVAGYRSEVIGNIHENPELLTN